MPNIVNKLVILLIAPRYYGKVGEHYEFPVGLACISSVLKKAGFNVLCVNLNHEYQDDKTVITEFIANNKIDIVCSGGLSQNFAILKEMFSIVKEFDSNIKTIIGGGIVSSEPRLIMENLMVDFGVLGEGEHTIVELVYAIASGADDFSKIDGLAYINDDKFIRTGERAAIEDLDSLPFPDYEGFEIRKYLDMQLPSDAYYFYPLDNPRVIPMISTRSCPFSCSFCYHPIGKKYRVYSLDYFFRWLDYLVETYSINMIVLLDELFSVNKNRMMEFASRIKKYNIKWIPNMRVDDVDEEVILEMKSAGMYYAGYGIESASDVVLKGMQKKITIAKIEKALEVTQKSKVGIQGNLIFGDATETFETATETFEWRKRNLKYQINLTMLIPYPGTKLYMDAVSNGRIQDKLRYITDGCPTINLGKMSVAEYGTLGNSIHYSMVVDRIGAKIIKSVEKGVHPVKGKLYEALIECSHCQKKVSYSNFHKKDDDVVCLCCKECNQKFFLSPVGFFRSEFEIFVELFDLLEESLSGNIEVAIIGLVSEYELVHFLSWILPGRWKQLNIKYCFDEKGTSKNGKFLDKDVLGLDGLHKYDFSETVILLPRNVDIDCSVNSRIFYLAECIKSFAGLIRKSNWSTLACETYTYRQNIAKEELLGLENISNIAICGTGEAAKEAVRFAKLTNLNIKCFIDDYKTGLFDEYNLPIVCRKTYLQDYAQRVDLVILGQQQKGFEDFNINNLMRLQSLY